MRINIVRNLCVAVWCFGLSSVFAAPVIPIAPGTSWRYNMTEEVGKGFSLSNLRADADGRIRLPVLYRVEGTENVDGRDLLKFEMHRAGAITNTDLLSVDDHGITCSARINLDGELVKFNPPQTMITFPLKKGAAWDFNGQAGELKVQQHYDVLGEEEIDVPAGKFHAYRIHGEHGRKHYETLIDRFAPDMVKDPMMRFLHDFFLPSHVMLGAILFAIGYFGWDAYTGWSFVVWGMFVRLVYVLHVTWFVNSATHMWGYRNYETTDDSRNLWWVGLLAFGEGWHNNHHAYQRMARHGHRWWEIDMTYWSIWRWKRSAWPGTW